MTKECIFLAYSNCSEHVLEFDKARISVPPWGRFTIKLKVHRYYILKGNLSKKSH